MSKRTAGLSLTVATATALVATPGSAAETAHLAARTFAKASPNGVVLFLMGFALIAFVAVAIFHWRLLTRAFDNRPRAVPRRAGLR